MPRPAAAPAPAPALSPRPPDAQPAAAAAGYDDEEQSSSSSPTCRICWGGESLVADYGVNASFANRLVAPCCCKGTCELVHLGCLESWLATSARAGKPPRSLARCELCGSPWRRGVLSQVSRSLRGRGRGRGLPPSGGGGGRRSPLRAAAAGAGALLSGLARACGSAASRTARRARSHPQDAALALCAAALAARGAAAGGRGPRRGAAAGARAEAARAVHSSCSLDVTFAALCMLAGLPASHVLRAMALTAGAEVVIVLPLAEGLPLGAVAGAVAGAAAGVARGLGRRASGAGRLIAGALSRAVSSSFCSPPRPSPRLLSTSSNTEATAAAEAEAAAAPATATAPASSLSALLSPMSSPPLSSLATSSRRAGGDVGLRTWEEDGEGGFLSSLAAAFVAAARGRGGLF